jgi:hypothetical protein
MKEGKFSQSWWHIPVILAFRRRRQEVCEFKGSLGYTVRPRLKKKKIKKRKWKKPSFLPSGNVCGSGELTDRQQNVKSQHIVGMVRQSNPNQP